MLRQIFHCSYSYSAQSKSAAGVKTKVEDDGLELVPPFVCQI